MSDSDVDDFTDDVYILPGGVMECQFSSFTTSNMIRKDPIFKTLMLSRKGCSLLLIECQAHFPNHFLILF